MTATVVNTCSFSYVRLRTNIPCRARGVEREWDHLKAQFEREGDGLPNPTARYFETISCGPQLFAVDPSQVYYHDNKKWHPYRSAYDIEFGTMEIQN